jgi:hypothetical protein
LGDAGDRYMGTWRWWINSQKTPFTFYFFDLLLSIYSIN